MLKFFGVLCGGDHGGVVVAREIPVAVGEVDRRLLIVGVDTDVGLITCVRSRELGLLSTLNNDALAFFALCLSCLLITSCHCSFALSSSRHHACRSSSLSADSSMFSLSSSSMAYKCLLPPFLHQAAMCPVLSHVPHVLVSPLPPFFCPLLPFLSLPFCREFFPPSLPFLHFFSFQL